MDFNQAMSILRIREGGYSDDPQDPGGETMDGITARLARAYGYQGAMKDIPATLVSHIAWQEFWVKAHCDDAPDAVRYDLFDMAFNSGFVEAVKVLQQAIGTIPADGDFGPITKAAASKMDGQLLSKRFNALRILFDMKTSNWLHDAEGWLNRITSNMLLQP